MFLFFYNFIIFIMNCIFYYFFIMNSARAHMNSTSILLFSMNSAPGPTWTVPPAHEQCRRAHVGPRLTAALQILEL